ncbi:hypothetical protein ONZ45_g11921 [Pleurotus djamor]|nr:hypothetical protein ONZ45_g12142 [Pleurotus djamor]KAJ8502018.1 hypothetical protein ONZ45_g11921 [Pleurotus djamor]
MASFPKIVALDTDNPAIKCGMHSDIPAIVEDILKNGAKLAIVCHSQNKAMCDRALWYWKAPDANGDYKPIIDLVSYDENSDKNMVHHFDAILSYYDNDASYSDMILFDDDPTSNIVEMMVGVTFQIVRGTKGLTMATYKAGIETWRRNQSIITPFVGLNLNDYSRPLFLGYSGMDIESIELLEKGWRKHDRKEAARWGYACYITDDPAIAKYFGDWIKYAFGGSQAKTVVCAMFARDEDQWKALKKVWVPETATQTNVNNKPNTVAWSQENRDRLIASWGVQKPYVLFSRHVNMNAFKQPNMKVRFPVPGRARWNEMVVYGQVQEAQLLTIRMEDDALSLDIGDPEKHVHYEKKIKEWGIQVPQAAWADFRKHKETAIYS